jgi:hypothetical protein
MLPPHLAPLRLVAVLHHEGPARGGTPQQGILESILHGIATIARARLIEHLVQSEYSLRYSAITLRFSDGPYE